MECLPFGEEPSLTYLVEVHVFKLIWCFQSFHFVFCDLHIDWYFASNSLPKIHSFSIYFNKPSQKHLRFREYYTVIVMRKIISQRDETILENVHFMPALALLKASTYFQ